MFDFKRKNRFTLSYCFLIFVGILLKSTPSDSQCYAISTINEIDNDFYCEMDDLSVTYDEKEESLKLTNMASNTTNPYYLSMFFRQYVLSYPKEGIPIASYTDYYIPEYNPFFNNDEKSNIKLTLTINPKQSILLRTKIFIDYTRDYVNTTLIYPNDKVRIEDFTATREENCGLKKVVKGEIDGAIVGNFDNKKSWAVLLTTSSSTLFYKYDSKNCTNSTKFPTKAPSLL